MRVCRSAERARCRRHVATRRAQLLIRGPEKRHKGVPVSAPGSRIGRLRPSARRELPTWRG